MALISCPECGREISDKVTACPHCGYPMVQPGSSISSKPQQVELTAVNITASPTRKAQLRKMIIAAVVAVVIIAAIFIGIAASRNASESERRAEYINNLGAIRLAALDGAAEAEDLCNLTKAVWRNAIYEDRDAATDPYTRPDGYWVGDFNTALRNLYAADSTGETISTIELNQAVVDEFMVLLQDPPEGLESCYDIVQDLYTAYQSLTSLAISPTGSLTTYSSAFAEADNEFINYYDLLGVQIPEE